MAAAAGPGSEWRLVEGANHFYNWHTRDIVEIIYQWLGRFAD
jgi:hypothetical protein